MPRIICYVPTYSPYNEADSTFPRPYKRLSQDEIARRLGIKEGRLKPWMYMDAIDSILNVRPDIKLVVADGRSTESIRDGLQRHHSEAGGYELSFYAEKMSQWLIFNDIFNKHKTADYFVYSSSDVIWRHDWIEEAIKAFDANSKLQILFPFVSQGDFNIPIQVAPAPRDLDPVKPPYDRYGQAPVLNAYAMIFRMDFLRAYGGYPDIFRNCYSESFLTYLCDAMGGDLRLLPRGWVFHWGLGDSWQQNGSHYYYNEEKFLFQEVMHKVQLMRAARLMTPNLLKNILWRK